eukprot:jgi/Astpho2/5927/Aster-02415
MPVAATFLLSKMLGIISVILVGHLGPSQLAASALGDSLANVTGKVSHEQASHGTCTPHSPAPAAECSHNSLSPRDWHPAGMSILASFGGAMQTLCGQAYGAKAYTVLGQVWQRAVLIMGLLCLPIAALWLSIGRLLLLMGQTPAVAEMTAAYMRLLIPGLFGQAALVTTRNYLSSQGIVVPPAAVSAGALVLHLPLALVCIHTFGLAYRGAALAVSVSYCLQFAALLAYILWSRVHAPTWGGWSRQCLREWWPFMRLALPSMLLVTEWWASEIVVMTGGLLPGDAQRQLSAMSIYQAVSSLCFMLPLGFGVAVTTRVSNELGAGNDDAAKQAAWTGTTLTVLSSAACALPLVIFRRQIAALFSPDRQLDSIGAKALLVLAPYVIGDGLQAVLSGVVKGAGRQASAVPIVLFSYYCVGVPLSLLLGFQAGLKVAGLCTGMLAGTIVHAGLYAALVARLDWKGEAHRAGNRVGSSKVAPGIE